MQKIRFFSFTLFLVLLSAYSFVHAQGVTNPYAEVCDERTGFLQNSKCPCPTNPGLASICGKVNDSNIVRQQDENGRIYYTARLPVSGATVSIYEFDPNSPTGQIYGKLTQKFIECETTEVTGEYFCTMRRINPGNKVAVIFSCNGKIAAMKVVPSHSSIVGFDADVSCSGTYSYRPIGDPNSGLLDYANRSNFLACTRGVDDYLTDVLVGMGSKVIENVERLYTNVETGITGGAVSFSASPRIAIGAGRVTLATILDSHQGGLWQNDCIVNYLNDTLLEDGRNIDYAPVSSFFGIAGNFLKPRFDSVAEKCNYNGALAEDLALALPYRFDLPDNTVEEGDNVNIRTWENRTSVQRELQDPLGFAQYLHNTVGECVGTYNIRRFQANPSENNLVNCNILAQCMETTSSNPFRNVRTSMGFASNLASPAIFGSLYTVGYWEDRDQPVCLHDEYGPVSISQIKPASYLIEDPEDHCAPGEPGCRWLLPSNYGWIPQFFFPSGAVAKPRTAESINDTAYYSNASTTPWEKFNTELDDNFKSGHLTVYPDEESGMGGNSGQAAAVIANSIPLSTEDSSDMFSNNITSPVIYDQETGIFDYSYTSTVVDFGASIESLCTVSGVSLAQMGQAVVTSSAEAMEQFVLNNFFKGNADDHLNDRGAGTEINATWRAIARDSVLNAIDFTSGSIWSALDEIDQVFIKRADLVDSYWRFISGEGRMDATKFLSIPEIYALAQSFIQSLEGGSVKSFGDRVNSTGTILTSPATAAHVSVEYCISEYDFEGVFPAFGQSGYPGDAGSCYPWTDVRFNDYCNSWPGREEDWGTIRSELAELEPNLPESWPGIDGELRTCRLERCLSTHLERYCTDIVCENDADGNPVCTCGTNWLGQQNTDIRYIVDECNGDEMRACLEEQRDTFPEAGLRGSLQDIRRNAQNIFNFLTGREYRDYYPAYDHNHDYSVPLRASLGFKSCDLQRAAFMRIPGDIEKMHDGLIEQKPFGGAHQTDLDNLSVGSNITKDSFLSPVEPKFNEIKGSFVDYAVTNALGEAYEDDLPTQRFTSGIMAIGKGTGAIGRLLDIVKRPERPSYSFVEYPPLHWAPGCNIEDPENRCYAREVPEMEPVYTDFIPNSCTPNTRASNCPLNDPYTYNISRVAELILGEAGYHARGDGNRVHGAILLAAIYGEGGWLNSNGRLGPWTDSKVVSWSIPWFGRMPHCDELVPNAQGPYGFFQVYFNAQVNAGGHHPLRISPTDGLPVVSRCNFLDASYAAASTFSESIPTCTTTDYNTIYEALRSYRGGTPPTATMMDIAINCR